MSAPSSELVCDAFGLGPPIGSLVPVGGEPTTTAWRLDTTSGRFLVKRVRNDEPVWWQEQAVRTYAFELAAISAGVDAPRPLAPLAPTPGYWTKVDSDGPVRVYEWLYGRRLRSDDDVAEWLGATLAKLTSIQASDRPSDEAYGLHPLDDWKAWFDDAKMRQMDWGEVGMCNLDGIAAASAFVRDALDEVGDFVLTHRDPEPWNMLITARGPVLLDFDWVGEESAWLVAAWAAVSYAMHERSEPDPARVRAVIDAYLAHGGHVACVGAPALARRVALRLIRLSYNVWIALGHRAAYVHERADRVPLIHEKLPTFLSLLRDVERWSRLLT